MSNKRPNQNKRDKKPALSSSNDAKNSRTKSGAAAQDDKKPAQNNSRNTTASANTRAASSDSQNTSPPRLSSTSQSGGSSDGSGQNKSWLAPLALLFGLIGTGFSTYLYTQLKSFKEAATSQLADQAAQTKSDVATVQTSLEQKTEELSSTLTASIDEKTNTLSAALEEKTNSLSTALEEKTNSLSTALEEKTSSLNTALEEKSADLSSSIDEKVAALSSSVESSLEQTSASVNDNLQKTTEQMQTNADESKTEIATSTAAAVQELTSKTELEINNISTSFNTGMSLLRERNTEKFDQINKQISDLDTSVKTTNELAMRGQRDWVLAEVNYLLRTGVHRVKLAGDVKAGVMALESASDRLHTLGDINYLPVREQIAEEVAALRRVGPPDIEGLIFKLQHMSKRADTLPLPPSDAEKTRQALAENPASAGAAIGESLLNRFKGSFKIVPSDGTAEPTQRTRKIKPTKEQLTASDSLRLHLQAARLSALRHDSGNFTDHMDNAIKYSTEIFDQSDDQVKTFISDLEAIRETNIVPKIPALGSSLALFTKVDSKRGNN